MAIKCPKCQFENPENTRFCGNCAAPLPQPKDIDLSTVTLLIPAKELARGALFAKRYEVIEELGEGGMGRVYRVLDKKINEELALKLIRPEIVSDRKTIERFGNELKIARNISHKNICHMYHLSEETGTHYITMEYIPGENLKSMIKMTKQLSVGSALSIAKQVCEGLAEAHRLGVVHRDLKPSNIMIDREGNARIMDFGIARSLEVKGITGAGAMIGTPQYMSPEQVEGKDVDQRSDIYSLGVILYEMVTGRVPFEGETALSVAHKHKYEAPKEPKSVNVQIPDGLNSLILKCLEKDREKRYQSASDLRFELDNIEKGITTTDRVVPKRKPLTSKEITVTFGLKKVYIPVSIFVVLTVVGVLFWQIILRERAAPSAPAQCSVAVLPFADLSPEKDHEYLSDGISEALINALSQLKDLRVPARTSAFSFKGKELDIREIGEKLNVENVLEGSVQVSEDKLRITAQLISIKDGYHLWSDKYDRRLEDVFAIQDEIAREIVGALKVKILGEEEAQLTKKHTENLEAYSFYLQGRYLWNKRRIEPLYKSIEYFEKALERDPDFVLAYAGLADVYQVLGNNLYIPPDEAYPKAREAALKALEIDNKLAEAHAAIASIMLDFDWNWSGAEKEFKLAIQLNPGYAYAHQNYAFLLSYLGRHEEAIKEIKTARVLDPLAPRIVANVGRILYYARKYDRALEELNKAIGIHPDHATNYALISFAYREMGRFEEALAYLQKAKEILPEELVFIEIEEAYLYAKWGKRKEAEELVIRIRDEAEKTYISPTNIAWIYGALGEIDQAFILLEKGYSEKDRLATKLKVEQKSDSLRSDRRFETLLKKLGLE